MTQPDMLNQQEREGYGGIALPTLTRALVGVTTRSKNFTPLREIYPPARAVIAEVAERPRQRHFFGPPQVVPSQADMLPTQW